MNVENKREQILLIMSIVCNIMCIFLIIFMLYIYLNNENTKINKNTNNKDNTSKLIFYDISFLKNSNNLDENYNTLNLIDNNLILYNKKIYNLYTKEAIFDGSMYDSIKYNNGYYIIEKDKKYGILNKDFKILIPIEYSNIEIPSENSAILETVNENSRITKEILNLNNNKTYGPYINVFFVNDNFIVAEKELDKYIIDIKNNKETIKNDDYSYTLAEPFQNKYIILDKLINDEYKYGVIDLNYKELVDFKYNKIENIDNKLLLVENNNKNEIIDINKNSILTIDSYNDIYIVKDVISIEDNTTKYYDFKGNLLYETENDSYIDYIGENYYLLRDFNNLCVYINIKDKTNKQIDYSYCDSVMNTNINGYLYKKENDKYLLYNNKLKKLSNQEYNTITLFDNYFIGEIDNLYYIFDYNNNKLIDKTFTDYKLTNNLECILKEDNGNLYYLKY